MSPQLPRARWSPGVVVAVIVMAAGCGGPAVVEITGTLTKKGEPMRVSEQTLVTLTFFADGEQKQTYPARFSQADGTYRVKMPPGTYRASVLIVDYQNKDRPPITVPGKDLHELMSSRELNIEIAR